MKFINRGRAVLQYSSVRSHRLKPKLGSPYPPIISEPIKVDMCYTKTRGSKVAENVWETTGEVREYNK